MAFGSSESARFFRPLPAGPDGGLRGMQWGSVPGQRTGTATHQGSVNVTVSYYSFFGLSDNRDSILVGGGYDDTRVERCPAFDQPREPGA